jgi:hypothetical protein
MLCPAVGAWTAALLFYQPAEMRPKAVEIEAVDFLCQDLLTGCRTVISAVSIGDGLANVGLKSDKQG